MCQHDIPRGRDPKQYITKRPRNAIKLGDRSASTYPPPPLKNALKSRSRFIGFRYQINGNAFLPPSIFFFFVLFFLLSKLTRSRRFTRDFMAGISCPIPRRESWSTYFRISNIQQLAGNGAVARNRGRAELRGGEEFCPAIAAPGRKK